MSKEIRLVCLVMAVLLISVCVLLSRNISVSQESNDIERQEETDFIRQEYERIVLGCQTAGAIASTDEWLRELCDEYLPVLREEFLLNR